MNLFRTGTGIDLGTYSVKAIQGKDQKGSFVLTRAVVGRLTDAGDVAPLLEGAKFRASKAILGLTGRDTILRYTHVPPLPEYKLRNLMKFEVDEISSQSGGEVAADYAPLNVEVPEGGDEVVLIGMAKKEFLEENIHILRKAKVRISSTCPNSIGLFNSFLKFGSFRPGETTLLMNIGAQNTDLAIQKDGDLLFARNLSAGGGTFTKALMEALRITEEKAEQVKISQGRIPGRGEDVFADAREERIARSLSAPAGQVYSLAQSTLQFCKAQTRLSDLKVDRIVISGGGARLRGLREYLSQNFGVPVELFDPMEKVDTSLLPNGDSVLEKGPELAVALGLAQMDAEPKFFRLDILPPREARKRRFLKKTIYTCLAGFLAFAFVVYDFSKATHNLDVHRRESDSVQKLKASREKLEAGYLKEKDALADLEKKYNALSEKVFPGSYLARALRLAQKCLPEELWITKVELEERRMGSKDSQEGEKAARYGVLIRGAGREGKQEKTISELSDEFARELRTDPLVDQGSLMSFDRKKKEFEIFLLFREEGGEMEKRESVEQ